MKKPSRRSLLRQSSALAGAAATLLPLGLAGGPPPPPDANLEERSGKNRFNAMKMAEILKIRLDCLNYIGSNSGQFKLPIVYGSGSEITGLRYQEFTEILLDKYKPD